MITIKVPWKEPSSVYDSNGPDTRTKLYLNRDLWVEVSPVEVDSINTGRRRYRVVCSCSAVLHEATTGPLIRIKGHLLDDHDIVCGFDYKKQETPRDKFHRLWTRDVGREGYCKEDWKELEKFIPGPVEERIREEFEASLTPMPERDD